MPAGVGFEQSFLQQVLGIRGSGSESNGAPTQGLNQRDHITLEAGGDCRVSCRTDTFSACGCHGSHPFPNRASVLSHVDHSALEAGKPSAMSTSHEHESGTSSAALPSGRFVLSQPSPTRGEWSSPGEPIHPGHLLSGVGVDQPASGADRDQGWPSDQWPSVSSSTSHPARRSPAAAPGFPDRVQLFRTL